MTVEPTQQRTPQELRSVATVFWPSEVYDSALNSSLIPELLKTQDEFISILNVPVADPDALFNVLDASTFPPGLFLLHLIVLTDVGKEMLGRINTFFDKLFPDRVLAYGYGVAPVQTYRFQSLPVKGSLDFKRLGLIGESISAKRPIGSLARDVVVLLMFGGAGINTQAAEVLQKCNVGNYLGRKAELERYVRQKYIWVSRITTGFITNAMGHLVEETVLDYLRKHLDLPKARIETNGHLPGVTHRGERSRSQRSTTFDIVVSLNDRYVAVEVSFQVTTNSVIERKGREALAVFNQVEQAGHKIAYVIDGAGNFQRQPAITNLIESSHCAVAFTESEFERLVTFVRGHLLS